MHPEHMTRTREDRHNSQPVEWMDTMTNKGNVWRGAVVIFMLLILACGPSSEKGPESVSTPPLSAADILGDPAYAAICYGGYRDTTRDVQPSIAELKEDMRLLSAIGIKVVRTYHTKRPHAANVVRAIHELKKEDPAFEMYVMLGAWIQCKGAFGPDPDHTVEDSLENAAEIDRAVQIAREFPDIVKVLAVGNEAMVHWQAGYHVAPGVILRWVRHVQNIKQQGGLPADLWVTCSDNFASWGGGGKEYHLPQLDSLIMAVDYVSMHTYPMHDTHYNPDFWGIAPGEAELSDSMKIMRAMERAAAYARLQYDSTRAYVERIDAGKPVHIGETGWATASNEFYGNEGSRATDEYKSGIYYRMVREWTDRDSIACFYFEGFDEIWKDARNPGGSENHFGLFDINGQAKYVIWDMVDQGVFQGLKRGDHEIGKTFDGDLEALMQTVGIPPVNSSLTATNSLKQEE